MKTYSEFMQTYIDRDCLARLHRTLGALIIELEASVSPYAGSINDMGDEFAPDYKRQIKSCKECMDMLSNTSIDRTCSMYTPQEARGIFLGTADVVKQTLDAISMWGIGNATDAADCLYDALYALRGVLKVYGVKQVTA